MKRCLDVKDMKYIFIFLVAVFQWYPSFAQDQEAFKEQGIKAYERGNYYLAASYLDKALKTGFENDTVIFMLAQAKRKVHSCSEALELYLQLSEKKSTAFPQASFYAGLMYKCLGNYENASGMFLQYSLKDDSFISKERVSQELKACEIAPQIIRDSLDVKIEQPGKHINSAYTDFGAVQRPNGMIYFSSLRPTVKSGADGLIPRDFQTDIYQSRISPAGYMRAQIWESPVNKKREHTANINFSPDGKQIFFTRCERLNGQMICEIYKSSKKAGKWRKAQKLPEIINVEGASTTHPYHTFTSGQEILYFVSDRKGSHGGLDIWYSIIQNDKYTTPVNLGSTVNTPGDEITPFYNVKDSTLYFSSNWHVGLGGFDIFKSKGGFASWSKPRNIGYPLNTPSNDLYYVINENNYSGYLTSNRPGSYFITSQNCCNDIFYYEFAPVKEKDSIPVQDSITTDFQKAKQLLPVTLYFDNDIPKPLADKDTTDKRIDVLLKKYAEQEEVYLKNYLFANSENYKIDKKNMQSFFKQVQRGSDKLDSLVDYLYRSLQKDEDINLVIKGYASPLTTKEYNLKLSRRRIVSLINYLKFARGGILKPYLNSTDTTQANLRIKQEAMGEVSTGNISDNPSDKRNSVYSLSAAKARKIVITDLRKESGPIHDTLDLSKVSLNTTDIKLDPNTEQKSIIRRIMIKNNSNKKLNINRIEADQLVFSYNLPTYEIKPGENIKMHLKVQLDNIKKTQNSHFKIYFKRSVSPLVIKAYWENHEK